MGVSKVAVVYSKNQQVVRRIIHFDRIADSSVERGWRVMTPDELALLDEEQELARHAAACHELEVFATIPHHIYHAFEHVDHIHAHLGLKGKPGEHDRHAIVDDEGNVVGVTLCDPAIDTHPTHHYVPHQTAIVGDKLALPKGKP